MRVLSLSLLDAAIDKGQTFLFLFHNDKRVKTFLFVVASSSLARGVVIGRALS